MQKLNLAEVPNLLEDDFEQFSQEKQVKQQEDVADSCTRWVENPTFGFAATTPKNGIKLTKLTISGDTITLDGNVREYSGLSLPNIDFSQSTKNDYDARIRLTETDKLAIKGTKLEVNSDLKVTGTIIGNIDAANITGTLSVERIPNLSADKITTGVLAGNLKVTGAIAPSLGNAETDGIMFPKVIK